MMVRRRMPRGCKSKIEYAVLCFRTAGEEPGAKMRESGENPEHCPVLYGGRKGPMAKAGH